MLTVYITAGYPNLDRTKQALKILDQANLSYIELGIPFSDPLADGPVIQNACFEALKQGVNLDKILDMLIEIKLQTPVIIFSAFNPLFLYGLDKLINKIEDIPIIKGLLVSDLPLCESKKLSDKLNAKKLGLVSLVTLTNNYEQIKKIALQSSPFIYLVSRIGITGSNDDVAKQHRDVTKLSQKEYDNKQKLKNIITTIKKYAPEKPLGLGFGIDSKQKVQEAFDIGCDMAIVGTKALRVLEKDQTHDLKDFQIFIESLTHTK